MKTNILKRWFASCLLTGVCLSLIAGDAPRFNLTGAVRDPDDHVIPQAKVIIYNAKPKDGSEWRCSPSYPDCRKQTVTDANGMFKIESLDANLHFCVLVAAPGFTAVLKELVEATDGPLDIALNPIVEARLKPGTYFKGRALDSRDKPVSGLKIECLAYSGSNSSPPNGGVDPVAVTDSEGRFILTAIRKFQWIDLGMSAPGFAPQHWIHVPNTDEAVLKIAVGATVTGRVLHRGKPAPQMTVRLESEPPVYPTYLGYFDAVTDDQGRFVFYHMPPYTVMQLQGYPGQKSILGQLNARKVRVPGDGAIKDIGDWSMEQ